MCCYGVRTDIATEGDRLSDFIFNGAIAIESGIYRQRLRLGFQVSMQSATLVNLAAVVVGWIAFLVIEPLSPPDIKAQLISYILFDRLLLSNWTTRLGAIIFAAGFFSFFITYFLKEEGLKLILRSNGAFEVPKDERQPSRDERYLRARQGRSEAQQALSYFKDTVIQANAASFSAILLILFLRAVAGGWS
ncbi:MAG: hypothetical protein HC800_24695 [Phormidesmis sp. RL_2_1]|nr:hypothetical protein [Phormidesmis sp. RL_2_1]